MWMSRSHFIVRPVINISVFPVSTRIFGLVLRYSLQYSFALLLVLEVPLSS